MPLSTTAGLDKIMGGCFFREKMLYALETSLFCGPVCATAFNWISGCVGPFVGKNVLS